MSIQRGLRLGDRVWVKAPTQTIERRIGTITSVGRDRYSVEWDIDTREGRREYTTREIAKVGSGNGRRNGAGLHK